MNGRRSLRRRPDQQAQAVENTSDGCNDKLSGSSESGSCGIQERSWHLHNSSSSMSSSGQVTVDNGEENGGHPSKRCPIEFSREVIAGESGSSTLLSESSTASQQKTICSFFGLLGWGISCIAKYISKTYNFIKKKFTIMNVIIAVLVIYCAIYCYCRYKKSTDVFSSTEMAQVYDAKLKSLWKSQRALEEQVREILPVIDQTERLRAEFSNIKEVAKNYVKQILRESDIPGENKDEVFALINTTFKKRYEDDVQMADWAQKTIGATIDQSRTSRTYEPEGVQDCWFRSLFMSAANPPDMILQPDVYPGNCWAFHGSQGQVVIKLPEKIQPKAVTVQHISRAVSPLGDVSSALKDFSVYGIDDETDEETLLGTFMYDTEKEIIQTFQLQNEAAKPFLYIKVKVQSNWGNMKFTCIYRVRVHGKRAEYLVPSEQVQA